MMTSLLECFDNIYETWAALGLLPNISAPPPPAWYLIPQYLNTMGMVRLTIPHTILPLPFHGEAADVPRVPPARPPQYLHTSFCKPWLIVWSVTLVFFN